MAPTLRKRSYLESGPPESDDELDANNPLSKEPDSTADTVRGMHKSTATRAVIDQSSPTFRQWMMRGRRGRLFTWAFILLNISLGIWMRQYILIEAHPLPRGPLNATLEQWNRFERLGMWLMYFTAAVDALALFMVLPTNHPHYAISLVSWVTSLMAPVTLMLVFTGCSFMLSAKARTKAYMNYCDERGDWVQAILSGGTQVTFWLVDTKEPLFSFGLMTKGGRQEFILNSDLSASIVPELENIVFTSDPTDPHGTVSVSAACRPTSSDKGSCLRGTIATHPTLSFDLNVTSSGTSHVVRTRSLHQQWTWPLNADSVTQIPRFVLLGTAHTRILETSVERPTRCGDLKICISNASKREAIGDAKPEVASSALVSVGFAVREMTRAVKECNRYSKRIPKLGF